MNPINQQQLIDSYIKKYGNLYPIRSVCSSYYVYMLESGTSFNTGFIRLNIIDQINNNPISNATITIYVTNGINRDIPIMHLITTLNPIRIELPMANELGTLIVGPEYDFSTYNLRVDAFGYFSVNIFSIRLFPNTTTDFNIEMIPVTQVDAQPLIEERIDIPPHPRDILNN